MARLPFLLSVPHAGLAIPAEVQAICRLSEADIRADGDAGAAELYAVTAHVAALVTTQVARAIVDCNRPPEDRGKDGIIKTHTCWDVPVYETPPTEATAATLIQRYWAPYHHQLAAYSSDADAGYLLGLDCHTMAETGPPVGPDPGQSRPAVCLSNGRGTCPQAWLTLMAECFRACRDLPVAVNHPFKGGYIIRAHSRKLPWLQVEFSRSGTLTWTEKQNWFLTALERLTPRLSGPPPMDGKAASV